MDNKSKQQRANSFTKREAREVFNINEGDTLILLGDKEKGIAIAKYEDYLKFAEAIFNAKKEN